MLIPVKHNLEIFLQLSLILLICVSGCRWFGGIVFENTILAALFLANSILLTFYFISNKQTAFKVFFAVYVILVFFQFKTTSIKNTYSLTPSEIDRQIQRMNYYPPRQARLGYILEHKREVKFVEKAIANFIETVDFNSYVPDYFSFWTLPLFLIGIFEYINNVWKERTKYLLTVYYLMFTVFCLSLLGIHGIYGPFVIFPFMILFIYIGVWKLFEVIKSSI